MRARPATSKTRFDFRRVHLDTFLNPNSEIGMGSTGDPPVPSGHWPDGRDRTLALKTDVRKSSGAFPVPSGGAPLGTGQWPVLPVEMATATSEFGFNSGFLFSDFQSEPP